MAFSCGAIDNGGGDAVAVVAGNDLSTGLTTGAIFATFVPVVSETTLVLLLLLVVAICCWFGAAGANVVQPADIFVLLLPLYGDDDCWRDADGGDGEE